MEGRYIVYGSPGSGSVPVEAALTLIGAPYEVIGETVLRNLARDPAVLKVNPLVGGHASLFMKAGRDKNAHRVILRRAGRVRAFANAVSGRVSG